MCATRVLEAEKGFIQSFSVIIAGFLIVQGVARLDSATMLLSGTVC